MKRDYVITGGDNTSVDDIISEMYQLRIIDGTEVAWDCMPHIVNFTPL